MSQQISQDNFLDAWSKAKEEMWLGDWEIVHSLLRTFAGSLMSEDMSDTDAFTQKAEAEARKLAKVFLGEDQRFKTTNWNRPGMIDNYVARKCGVQSTDPEEKVAGGLLNCLHELLYLSMTRSRKKLLDEQWQPAVTEILERYSKILLGIPGSDGIISGHTERPSRTGPESRLPKT